MRPGEGELWRRPGARSAGRDAVRAGGLAPPRLGSADYAANPKLDPRPRGVPGSRRREHAAEPWFTWDCVPRGRERHRRARAGDPQAARAGACCRPFAEAGARRAPDARGRTPGSRHVRALLPPAPDERSRAGVSAGSRRPGRLRVVPSRTQRPFACTQPQRERNAKGNTQAPNRIRIADVPGMYGTRATPPDGPRRRTRLGARPARQPPEPRRCAAAAQEGRRPVAQHQAAALTARRELIRRPGSSRVCSGIRHADVMKPGGSATHLTGRPATTRGRSCDAR